MWNSKACRISALFLSAFLAISPQPALSDELPDMISPVTHPVNFEDPRHSTELRPLYVYHEFDDDFVTGGGDAQIYALQARFKLTDDFSIIATKDGYVDLNPDGVVPQDEGFANVALGVKYSFLRDTQNILTGGLRYELPIGEEEVLQGEGDGIVNPFLSYGTTACGFNFMAGTGFRIPIDDDDSFFYDLDLHASYKIGNFYPLVEFGLIHVIDGGGRLPIEDEGQDYFNFGSSAATGESIVTAAAGARYRITNNIDVGAAYQVPLNEGNGSNIIDYRVTTDLIFRF